MIEELRTWLESSVFEFNNYILDWRTLVTFALVVIFLFIAYRTITISVFHRLVQYKKMGEKHQNLVQGRMRWMFLTILIMSVLYLFNVNVDLLVTPEYDLQLSIIFVMLLLYQIAYLLDYLFSNVFLKNRSETKVKSRNKKDQEDADDSPTYTIRYTFYLITTIFLLQYFNLDVVLFQIPTGQDIYTRVFLSNVFLILLFIILARFLARVITSLFLHSYYKRKNIDIGAQYAVNQLIKYFIYVITFVIVIESIGLKMTVLWGGAAALLVGVGLGLQQTFNDLMSGIILLFERSIEVGDVIEIDRNFGIVHKIGLRTSLVETRDNVMVIVPNSKLIDNSLVNWSHFDDKASFEVEVGVAYGSDTDKVENLLIEVAQKNPYVLEYPTPNVFFTEFSDSALGFKLHFWTRNFMLAESIKSDLRFETNQIFKKNDIEVPFPQRDVWFKNAVEKHNVNDNDAAESVKHDRGEADNSSNDSEDSDNDEPTQTDTKKS